MVPSFFVRDEEQSGQGVVAAVAVGDGTDIGVGISVRVILRIDYLFADRRKNFLDRHLAETVGNESRDGESAIGKNRIRCACLVARGRLEQPRAFADFNSKYAGLFGRAVFVRRFPAIEIRESILHRPRFLEECATCNHDRRKSWPRAAGTRRLNRVRAG